MNSNQTTQLCVPLCCNHVAPCRTTVLDTALSDASPPVLSTTLINNSPGTFHTFIASEQAYGPTRTRLQELVGFRKNIHNPNPCLQARLIKLIVASNINIPARDIEYRVFELTLLVPDLAKRLHNISPSTLATLLQNTTQVAARLISLRQLLPTANVGALVARQPDILLQVPSGTGAVLVHTATHDRMSMSLWAAWHGSRIC